MSNDPRSTAEPSTTSLLGGIISDLGDLIKQEVRFARAEFKADLGKTREAATTLAIGAGVASLSGFLLAWMLVYLLHWATDPAPVPMWAPLPLWACFGIVGALFALVGGLLVMSAVRKFQAFNILPDETAQSLKENVKWIANSK